MSSLDKLRDIFAAASSQDQTVLRWATTQLARLSQEEPTFYSAILKIAVDRNEAMGVRLQAILYLKNALDNIWRNKLLSDEEKQLIRNLLLTAYNESSQISIHIAVVISKIARFDCPQNWPELIPELANAIDGSVARADSVTHERALFILYHVVKTLASKRLAVDKRVFHELCARVFDPVFGYWKAHLPHVGTQETSSSSALLCLKSLRYMAEYGFTDRSKETSCRVDEFLQSLSSDVQAAINLLSISNDPSTKENLQKIVHVTLKLAVELQERNPLEFVRWMPSFLELANYCAFGPFSTVLSTLAQVRAINLLTLVVLCHDYKPSTKDTEESKVAAGESCKLFFSADRIRAFCQAIIERYLVLTKEELETWRDDPEAYATTEDSESWSHMIRPAAENLLIALVHEYWEEVALLAKSWLDIAKSANNVQTFEQALALDTVLIAIGLVAADLHEEVDFDGLFSAVCLPLISMPTTNEMQKILVRRIIWLCGKWIDVKFSKELRNKFYESVLRIIGSGNEDIVLRITACDALKRALDEYEFDLEAFRPYLNESVSAMIALLKTCQESGSQMHVITTLWLLAERAGREVSGSLGDILAYVPVLWQSENCMLKGQILNLFTQIVKGLGSDCAALIDGLTIMLNSALNTEDSSHVYLLEEGLDLWLALLENSCSPLPPQLLLLFRFMPQLLTVQSENLRVCCDIVKAYCLYMDLEFAHNYLPQLGQIFHSLVGEMRNEGVVVVLKVVEIIIRCYREEALAPLSNVIIWCIQNLASEEMVNVRLMCAAIISLVSVQNVQKLYDVMATSMTEQQIIAFVQKWLLLINVISHDMERSKANGLGLCAWLTIPTRILDPLFPDIISTLVAVLLDICVEENGSYVDSLVTYDFGVYPSGDDNSGFVETEHDKRTLRLRDFDPIYNTSLQTCVLNALNAKKQMYGEEAFAVLWSIVNPDHVEELKKLNIG